MIGASVVEGSEAQNLTDLEGDGFMLCSLPRPAGARRMRMAGHANKKKHAAGAHVISANLASVTSVFISLFSLIVLSGKASVGNSEPPDYGTQPCRY